MIFWPAALMPELITEGPSAITNPVESKVTLLPTVTPSVVIAVLPVVKLSTFKAVAKLKVTS
ncbi:hypothetical protein LOD63_10935, partial [Xylella fastidiosa subsp. multiplex]